MIQTEQLLHARNRRQRALRRAAFAAGLALILCVLALGVVSWGWIPMIAVAYAVPSMIFVAIFVIESRNARRDAGHAEADEDE